MIMSASHHLCILWEFPMLYKMLVNWLITIHNNLNLFNPIDVHVFFRQQLKQSEVCLRIFLYEAKSETETPSSEFIFLSSELVSQ